MAKNTEINIKKKDMKNNNIRDYLEQNFPDKDKQIIIIIKIINLEGKLEELKYPELDTLVLSFMDNVDLDSLDLKSLVKLRFLTLSYNSITKLGDLSSQSNLTQLNLSGNPGITINALELALNQLPSLTHLILRDNELKGGLEKINKSKNLIHLDIKGSGFSYGLELLPNLAFFKPSKYLEEELSYYKGNNPIEQIEEWKKDEINQVAIRAVKEFEKAEYVADIEKVNSNWKEVISEIKRMTFKYSKENALPAIIIYPAKWIAGGVSPFGIDPSATAYVNWRVGSRKLMEYHFAIDRGRIAIIGTWAHEISHLIMMNKEVKPKVQNDSKNVYPNQYHSPEFWKNYLGEKKEDISTLGFLKKLLSREDWQTLENQYDPASPSFDSLRGWIYFPNVFPGKETDKRWKSGDMITKKKVFKSQEKGKIANEFYGIVWELAKIFEQFMNEGQEGEKEARWASSDEAWKMAMSMKIKINGDGTPEIGVIYNPEAMPEKEKKLVEQALRKWSNNIPSPTNIEKAKEFVKLANEHGNNQEQMIAQVIYTEKRLK